jgi:LEA14-like dessication related protein
MVLRYSKLLLSVLAGALLAGCAAIQDHVKEPNVTVQDLQVRGVSLTGMDLDFILGIDNPNPIGISMSGLTYRLELNDRALFEGASQERVSVAGNGHSQVTLPFTLVYEEILGSLNALAGRQTLPYTLSGKVDLGLFSFPYSKRGELQLPGLPDVQISRLSVDRIDLSGVALQLALKVSNPNDFPLQLSGLSGGIKLADVSLVEGHSIGRIAIGAQQHDEVNLALRVGYQQLGNLVDRLRRADTLPLAFDGSFSVPSALGERRIPLHWSGEVPVSR